MLNSYYFNFFIKNKIIFFGRTHDCFTHDSPLLQKALRCKPCGESLAVKAVKALR